MNPETWKPDETPTYIYSPLRNTLTVEMYDEKNERQLIDIPPQEALKFPKWQADVLKKHIVDGIINERQLGFVSPEERVKLDLEVEIDLNG